MAVVGYVFLALVAIMVIGVLTMTAASVPDISRYLRNRKM